MKNEKVAQALLVLGALASSFVLSSAAALILGTFLALTFGNPFLARTSKLTPQLLMIAVIGIGAGMNLLVVGRVGLQGIEYTVIGISSTLLIGFFLGKFLKIGRAVSVLISVGTAICGGSAIAATAPVIRAKSSEISVALGTVFLLNAVALIIFPLVGHYFQLTEAQFGLWSALAIHDTSSVVGATLQYGPRALEVGTTVKLTRALWIVPVALLIGSLYSRGEVKNEKSVPAKKPWFILGFLMMAALVTWVPQLQEAGHLVEFVAKRLMVLTLFLIGAGLNRENLKSVGLGPFFQGLLLWVLVAGASLGALLMGWIQI